MQLVAYGAQDIYLTGNPQITFFKVVYRRHTNFSMEEIEQTPNGPAKEGGTASFTISRNGDLVHKMYFEVDTKNITVDKTDTDFSTADESVATNLGNTLIKEVECEIGGQKIDKHYDHWLSTWADLTDRNDRGFSSSVYKPTTSVFTGSRVNTFFADNVGGGSMGATLFQKTSFNMGGAEHAGATADDQLVAGGNDTTYITADNVHKKLGFQQFHIPLQFWFNRNPGLALPLIALQYHEVKIITKFATHTELFVSENSFPDGAIRLFTQYIYLDTDERRRFAQVSHEYLIEQLQFHHEGPDTRIIDLNFNHPVKELIWTGSSHPQPEERLIPLAAGTTFKLQLNGHDRFSERDMGYFSRQQIYDYHTGYGGFAHDSDSHDETIAVYSFALKPEEHQPSGTCNFSRIDTAQLIVSESLNWGLYIYAVNYNVLRIMSGMGGLAYSN